MLAGMRAEQVGFHVGLIVTFAAFAVIPAFGQAPASAKATKSRRATKAAPPFTFEAHNEGSVEGAVYGDANLVAVTIDSTGIRYQGKGVDKPYSIPWDQVSSWQANSFTSIKPGRADGGDFGIGVYQGAHYFSFRTRNGGDYLAAVRILRALASSKERAGIG